MVIVMLIVHLALWAHANAVAQAAAEHGAEVAAAFGASLDEGRDAAESFADQAGQIKGVVAVVTGTDGDVTVTVSGTYPSVIGELQVEATTTIARERIGAP